MPLAFLVEKPELWLPGPWLVCVGVAIALLILAIVLGVSRIVSHRSAALLWSVVCERTMQWALGWAACLAVVAVVGAFLVPTTISLGVAESLLRIPLVRSAQWDVTIPAGVDRMNVEIRVPLADIDAMTMSSEQPLTIDNTVAEGNGPENIYYVKPDQPAEWERQINPIDRRLPVWTVTNTNANAAVLSIDIDAGIEYPQAYTVLIAAGTLLFVVAAYVLVRVAMPKVSAIAMASAQETMSQWLFALVMLIGVLLLKPVLLPVPSLMHIPYNTFGEDIKMLKQGGVRVVAVLATIVALWSASMSISEELEGRTALTLLSKPVSRRQFILGKFLGIVWPVVVITLVLGSLLLWTVASKVVYDMRESPLDIDVTWQLCHAEMARTAPALLLGFFSTVVLSAISVALSTRLPMLANLVVCASIYALGHLAPLVVQSSAGKFPIVTFVGQLIVTILPVLDHFDVPGAVVGNADVPASYLAWSGLYAALYSTTAIVFALAMFEDRDLA
ncbi:MAG: hypothetical protein WD875_15310 [Pirellulales bacterium]